MKLAILTTDTSHHCYFTEQLLTACPDLTVYSETKTLQAKFETAHAYETQRDEYERELWNYTDSTRLSDFCATNYVESMNDADSINMLKKNSPDIIIVFGTGKLSSSFIQQTEGKIINLHGGDPERYRGLDTHLWACYHGDFSALKTCLHILEERLDTGAIIDLKRIPINKNMSLKELRAANTKICVDLCKEALNDYAQNGSFSTVDQKQLGRYYSFMPCVLKEIARDKFEKYTAKL